jgi:hypothetical protein
MPVVHRSLALSLTRGLPPSLLPVLCDYRRLVNEVLREALLTGKTSRGSMSRFARDRAFVHQITGQHAVVASEIALSLAKAHRTRLRRGGRATVPYVRRPFLRTNRATFHFDSTTGKFRLSLRNGEWCSFFVAVGNITGSGRGSTSSPSDSSRLRRRPRPRSPSRTLRDCRNPDAGAGKVGQLSRGARDRRSAADSPVGPGGNCIARSNTRPPGVACQSTGSTRSERQRPARDVGSTMVPEAGWARCSSARAASGDWIASSTRERTSHKPFCATTVGQNLEVSDLTSTPSPRIR